MPTRNQTMIVVKDVRRSSKWYCSVLGCTSGHGGDEYEMIVDGSRLVMQLHSWDDPHHHGNLGKKSLKSRGNGVLLWFAVDDFDRSVRALRRLKAQVVVDVHTNPNAGQREIWVKDPDGYTLVIAGPRK